MKTQNTVISSLATLAISASFASASIVGTSGGVVQIGPPASCVPGALAGLTAYAWDEKQNVSLSLVVDMVNNPGSSNAPIPGTISGTFDSHFLHFDQVPGAAPVTGTVTFSSPIVAVIFRNVNLDNSDGPAGSLGTTYPTGYPFRGLINAPNSFVIINGSVLTFNLSSVFSAPNVDQVRVITQAPAPGAAALLGLSGLACFRRRR